MAKGEGARLIYQIHAEQRTDLEVRLRPEGFDALASDNIAYIDLASSRVLSVHVHPNLSSFRLALRSIEGLRVLSQGQEKETPKTDFDLVVSNREEELGLAAPVYLFVGVVPPDVTEIISIDVLGTTIVDWHRIAILPEHVTLSEVLTLDNPVWSGEAREEALEVLGYKVLAYGERGSLLLHKREDETMYYYMLFDSDRSTMPFRLGFRSWGPTWCASRCIRPDLRKSVEVAPQYCLPS